MPNLRLGTAAQHQHTAMNRWLPDWRFRLTGGSEIVGVRGLRLRRQGMTDAAAGF